MATASFAPAKFVEVQVIGQRLGKRDVSHSPPVHSVYDAYKIKREGLEFFPSV